MPPSTVRTRIPTAPKALSPDARKLWRQVCEEYDDLGPHHLKILQSACECWDRMASLKATIDQDGAIMTDRFGQKKPHPALKEERQARETFARLIRELGLDLEPPEEAGRPPRQYS